MEKILNPIPQGYEGGVHLKGGADSARKGFWVLGAGYDTREG